jgi:hypothetical protein
VSLPAFAGAVFFVDGYIMVGQLRGRLDNVRKTVVQVATLLNILLNHELGDSLFWFSRRRVVVKVFITELLIVIKFFDSKTTMNTVGGKGKCHGKVVTCQQSIISSQNTPPARRVAYLSTSYIIAMQPIVSPSSPAVMISHISLPRPHSTST